MTALDLTLIGLLGALYYVYDGYGRVLAVLAWIARDRGAAKSGGIDPRAATILVTVFNEQDALRARLENLLEAADGAEILVASDGSTDTTDDIVREYAARHPNVRLHRCEGRIGKSATQNSAMATASGRIVILTDAGTIFDRNLVHEMLAAFADGRVGGATARLLFTRDIASAVAGSQGYYWRYELRLRRLESVCGILAVASGACMALRKDLFVPMSPAHGDDCIIPLDVVCAGARFVHVDTAVAYDRMDSTVRSEFRTRIRMTLRNWVATWARPRLLNPFRHPGYAFALWSHKILRWLSPFLILSATGVAIAAAARDGGRHWWPAAAFATVYSLGAVGWLASLARWRVPLCATVFNFLLANTGFLVGTVKALRGQSIVVYKK